MSSPTPQRSHRQALLRYGIVGLSGYALSVAIFAGLLAAGVATYLAPPVGFVANSTWNFVLNRAWSFGPSGDPVHQEAARFTVIALASLALNYVVLFLLHSVAGFPAVPSQAAAILAVIPLGYLGQRLWAFGPSVKPHADAL